MWWVCVCGKYGLYMWVLVSIYRADVYTLQNFTKIAPSPFANARRHFALCQKLTRSMYVCAHMAKSSTCSFHTRQTSTHTRTWKHLFTNKYTYICECVCVCVEPSSTSSVRNPPSNTRRFISCYYLFCARRATPKTTTSVRLRERRTAGRMYATPKVNANKSNHRNRFWISMCAQYACVWCASRYARAIKRSDRHRMRTHTGITWVCVHMWCWCDLLGCGCWDDDECVLSLNARVDANTSIWEIRVLMDPQPQNASPHIPALLSTHIGVEQRTIEIFTWLYPNTGVLAWILMFTFHVGCCNESTLAGLRYAKCIIHKIFDHCIYIGCNFSKYIGEKIQICSGNMEQIMVYQK